MSDSSCPPPQDLVARLREEWLKEAPELDTQAMDIVGRVIQLAGIWEVEANNVLKEYGLKYTDFDIIATLRRSGPPYELTPTQLRQSVLLTSGAMTTALSRVEKMGLIERSVSEQDGRVNTARLTEQGQALALRASKARFSLAKEQASSLTNAAQTKLKTLLQEVLVQSIVPDK